MGPAVYLLAILGCGEGEAACEAVRVLPARYESHEACVAATAAAAEQAQDAPYPVVVAQCRRQVERPRPLGARDVARPTPEANRHFPARPS